MFALRWALKKLPFTPELSLAADGQQALDFLSNCISRPESIPSLVLLDLKLPFFSGHEILEWIRARREFDGMRVVILSGSDEAADHFRADGNGADGYLVKPATPQQLEAVLCA